MERFIIIHQYDAIGQYQDTYAVRVLAATGVSRSSSASNCEGMAIARLQHPDLNGGRAWNQEVRASQIVADEDLAGFQEE